MPDVSSLLREISTDRLKESLYRLSGERNAWEDFTELELRADFIEKSFTSFGLQTVSQDVPYHGRSYRNIVATLGGRNPEAPALLVGAHFDASLGSAGADDNASGVAALLESARILSALEPPFPVEFAAFTLEEQQPVGECCRNGSKHFARQARREGRAYRMALIFESVGFTSPSQIRRLNPPLFARPAPQRGDFLAVVSNRASRDYLEAFGHVSRALVPDLPLEKVKVPFNGRLLREARFSDHSSFWDRGIPALMLTDTVNCRNPNYHRPEDTPETLDWTFLTRVTQAACAFVAQLAEDEDQAALF